MKKLFFIIFLLSTSFVFSQNKPKNDSTEICFPYQVGQKILLELNECDKNKELLKIFLENIEYEITSIKRLNQK